MVSRAWTTESHLERPYCEGLLCWFRDDSCGRVTNQRENAWRGKWSKLKEQEMCYASMCRVCFKLALASEGDISWTVLVVDELM